MTIEAKVELYHPDEMEAFAAFLTASAAAYRKRDAERPKNTIGGIARLVDDAWRVHNDGGQNLTATQAAAASEVAVIAAAEAVAEFTRAAESAPTRERGKPSQGRARRTKEEIAEDEAAAEADRVRGIYEGVTDQNSADKEMAIVMGGAAISTGEERVGPEDDAETVAQDEADEAAETEAAREPEKPLTLDDVRGALGAYVKKYGMAAAQADGPKVIALALKNPAAVKVSDIPDDQASIGAVLAGINEMIAKNPFGHKAVA